jgi:hypothetical protein
MEWSNQLNACSISIEGNRGWRRTLDIIESAVVRLEGVHPHTSEREEC